MLNLKSIPLLVSIPLYFALLKTGQVKPNVLYQFSSIEGEEFRRGSNSKLLRCTPRDVMTFLQPAWPTGINSGIKAPTFPHIFLVIHLYPHYTHYTKINYIQPWSDGQGAGT
jgi:hypothetical protein